ncbi:hypothetical protein L0128_01770 [candidate division KSB1 bacterium]|nr:hypothetical protein [candidate division KSB1 bacterium]
MKANEKLLCCPARVILLFGCWLLLAVSCQRTLKPQWPENTYFIDDQLTSQLKPAAPFSSSGSRLWASSLWNWGFSADVQILHVTNFNALPIKIEADGAPVMVKGGVYYPSHHVLEGETDSAKSNLAYNPFQMGLPQPTASVNGHLPCVWRPINGSPAPAECWTTHGAAGCFHWYAVALENPELVLGAVIEFSPAESPSPNALPKDYFLEYEQHGKWKKIPGQHFFPSQPASELNLVTFPRLVLQKIRICFQTEKAGAVIGLKRFQVQGVGNRLPQVLEEKFITADDVLISLIQITNPSYFEPLEIVFKAFVAWGETVDGQYLSAEKTFFGQPLTLVALIEDFTPDTSTMLTCRFQLAPRTTRKFKILLGCAPTRALAHARVDFWRKLPRPLQYHRRQYDTWFRTNVPYFFCASGRMNRQYYQYWQKIRRNFFDPAAGLVQHPTFAAGRHSRVDLSGVMLDQAPWLLRDLRWLRAPHYAQDFIRTITANQDANGVFPTEIKVHALRTSPITLDRLVWACWETYLVHPDLSFLAAQFPLLTQHCQRLRTEFDADQDGLFCGFPAYSPASTASRLDTEVAIGQPIRSGEDLESTIYFYQNIQALAQASQVLGNTAMVASYNLQAQQIKTALQQHFWDAEQGFFVAAERPSRGERIRPQLSSLYPFSARIPTSDQLGVWRWFMASLARRQSNFDRPDSVLSPAAHFGASGFDFSQINSEVLAAVRATLQNYPASCIKPESFWKIFEQCFITPARNPDSIRLHLTAEFMPSRQGEHADKNPALIYNGLVDFLITGLIGLVPQATDDKIVVQPLLPEQEWRYFILERVPYHGHELTFIWDAPGGEDFLEDDQAGFEVFLDGKLKATRPVLGPLTFDFLKK